jgi:hypothetical protein
MDDLGVAHKSGSTPAVTSVKRKCTYAYPVEVLGNNHYARCGNAAVYRSSGMEGLTGFGRVVVLDMGAYLWSGTLKDPRSWAILNTALALGLTDISVWTAGNAGLSLAKLAYHANRRLARDRRIQIHAIVDNDVAPEIRVQLRLWQCEVLDVFRQDKPILNPEEIRGLVANRLRRSWRSLDEASYWHVTDGWDGVGLVTYRLIAAQTLRDLSVVFSEDGGGPVDIVLPVGTGDLLLGFYQGLRDCEEAGFTHRGAYRLVGVFPAGMNILDNIRQRSIPARSGQVGGSGSGIQPVMPKLASLYTPLAPCLARMVADEAVRFICVTAADQLRAGRQILAAGIDDGIVAEPSAVAAFAALPHLDDEGDAGEWAYRRSRRVLVVNSGMGILGHDEEALLRAAIGG